MTREVVANVSLLPLCTICKDQLERGKMFALVIHSEEVAICDVSDSFTMRVTALQNVSSRFYLTTTMYGYLHFCICRIAVATGLLSGRLLPRVTHPLSMIC